MASAVEKLQREVTQIFEDASEGLRDDIRAVVADHSVKGTIKSGATIRRVIAGFETQARMAMEKSNAILGASTSVALRSKLAAFQVEGVDRLRDQANERLARFGLADKAGQVLMEEKRIKVLREVATRPRVIKPSKWLWIGAVAAWSVRRLDLVVVGVISAVIAGIILAAL